LINLMPGTDVRATALVGPLGLLFGLMIAACGGEVESTATAVPPTAVTETAPAPVASTEWTDHATETASYRILLRTGPTATMEVMQMGAIMTAVDQGQAVNHHLEVHIFDKRSGAELKNLVPTVGITEQATGDSRELAADLHPSGELPYVKACLLSNHRVKEPHFGDNLYLRDGTYTVTVSVNGESAVYGTVAVKAAG
jgi:hypothetical protein